MVTNKMISPRKPLEVEFGPSKVYVRTNIVETPFEYGGEARSNFTYDETIYSHCEYSIMMLSKGNNGEENSGATNTIDESRIVALENSNKANSNKITSLENKDKELQNSIKTLQDKDADLEGEISNLKSKDTEIDNELSGLKSKDTELENMINGN